MRKKKEPDYSLELQKAYDRWEEIYRHGCSDPFWEDGINLNLVRNHILYYKDKIKETMEPDEYPNLFYEETPPEVPMHYIADADGIRRDAKKSLKLYENHKDYQWLLNFRNKGEIEKFNKTDYKEINSSLNGVLGYVSGLKLFIKKDSLIEMRRHRKPERYITSFSSLKKRIEGVLERYKEMPKEKPFGQLSIFDFL